LQVRYFFNVEGDGSIFNDEEGTVLSGLDVAMLQAAVIAAELAQNPTSIRDMWSVLPMSTAAKSARCRSLLRLKTASSKRAQLPAGRS
jgi:hypothetical protein